MKIPSLSDLPSGLVDQVRAARAEADRLDRLLSKTILDLSGVKVDDIVEDPDTGARYRIDYASADVSRGWPSVHMMGKRVWKSGRKAGKEARSSSFITSRALPVAEGDL